VAHVESLSRPLLAEGAEELIEASLPLQEVLGGRLGGLPLEPQIYPLRAAVLLRVFGLDALDIDSEMTAPETGRGKRGKRTGCLAHGW
jgi:hypothetical protein